MNIQEEIRINDHQPVCGCAGTELGDFFQEYVTRVNKDGFNIEINAVYLMSLAYTYGVICGKRSERARRK